MKTTYNYPRIYFFLILFLTIGYPSTAQEKISLVPPKNWIEFQRNEVMNTIYNKYTYSEKVIKELEKNGKKSIQLLGYYTNEIKSLYRPNIQVILRPNTSKNIESFKDVIKNSLPVFANTIKEFEIIDQPKIIKIAKKDAIIVKFKGYNLTKDNQKSWFETIMLAIPINNIFYQITLNQSPKDNLNDEFRKVIDTIKFD